MNRSLDYRGIPRSVWVLGLVSLFMDISSEMIHSLLPVFLAVGLGVSALSIGFIEGAAEATALITRVFSGYLSDRLGKRKALAVAGYAIGTLTKPLFALATGVKLVFAARFLDRIGKGIRGAPRDALITDITSVEMRGASFGLRQSMDTAGAVAGPLLASLLMFSFSDRFRPVFWCAVLPGVIAVMLLAFGVREPEHQGNTEKTQPPRLSDIGRFGRAFWLVVVFGSVFTLARFSEAFLLLRAQNVGVSLPLVPIFLVIMNIVYTMSAYPAGIISDRMGRTVLLVCGCIVLIAADMVLAFASGPATVAVGVALWGLHMGFTQGIFAALVADTSPGNLRGSAFGIFSMITGIAMLAASVIAGLLWESLGPGAPFLTGAACAASGLAGYCFLQSRKQEQP
jgi:MFS family permease